MSKTVQVNFIGNDHLSKVTKEATSSLDRFQQKVGHAGSSLTKFATVPIVAALGLATKAALAERKEIASLEAQIKAATGTRHKSTEETEKWITTMQNATAFQDSEVRASFGRLISITKNYNQAQAVTAFAADLARSKNVDLATATDALVSAETGRTKGLQKMGIEVKDASGKALSLTEIMEKNKASVQGAAQAYANGAGKGEVLKHKMDDLKESIGNALVPVVDTLTKLLTKVADWFAHLSDGSKKLIVFAAVGVAALGPLLKAFNNLLSFGKGISKMLIRMVPEMEGAAAATQLLAVGAVAAAAAIGTMIGLKVAAWINSWANKRQLEGFKRDLEASTKSVYRNASTENLEKLAKNKSYVDYDLVVAELHRRGIPGFATGGIMPGPIGAPGLAILHGGERVTPPGQSASVVVHVYGSVTTERELVSIIRSALLKTGKSNVGVFA